MIEFTLDLACGIDSSLSLGCGPCWGSDILDSLVKWGNGVELVASKEISPPKG